MSPRASCFLPSDDVSPLSYFLLVCAWCSVEEVYVLLRRMVDNIANADELRLLKRYPTLKREIVS